MASVRCADARFTHSDCPASTSGAKAGSVESRPAPRPTEASLARIYALLPLIALLVATVAAAASGVDTRLPSAERPLRPLILISPWPAVTRWCPAACSFPHGVRSCVRLSLRAGGDRELEVGALAGLLSAD